MIEAAPSYEARAALIRNFVRQDPARAALVVRDLIRADTARSRLTWTMSTPRLRAPTTELRRPARAAAPPPRSC